MKQATERAGQDHPQQERGRGQDHVRHHLPRQGDLRGGAPQPGAAPARPWHGCTASPTRRISDFVEFDPAYAIKFTIYRERPSGSPGDSDIFGAQQYAPLLDIEVMPA